LANKCEYEYRVAASRRMNPRKAAGPDGIPPHVLHLAMRWIGSSLQTLFTACIQLGYHPTAFRKATTIMLPKPGKDDYTNPSSYRPIALLNTLGKLLEAIVAQRMRDLAEVHKLLPDTQYGARPGRSTEAALYNITEQIHTIWNKDSSLVASVLSLDVSKAFDRVSHHRLLHNLRKRRCPEILVRWIQSFLSDRRTTIRISDHESPEHAVQVGIPQGSPVSPILYLFYNADLLEICQDDRLSTNPTGFVDDVNILTYSKSAETNCQNLSQIHERCIHWSRRHGCQFCPSKYELIHFVKPKRNRQHASLELGNTIIEPKANIRVLGVRLDCTLSAAAHVQAIEAKIPQLTMALQMVTGATWGISLPSGREIYRTVVRPALTYGAGTWYRPRSVQGWTQGIDNRLRTVQARCLRVIAGAYRATAGEALEVETYVEPLDLYITKIAAEAAVRHQLSSSAKGTTERCQRIRESTNVSNVSQRGGRKHTSTPRQQLLQWVQTKSGQPLTRSELDDLDKARQKNERQKKRASQSIETFVKIQWRLRWARGSKGQHSRTLTRFPSKDLLKIHAGRPKWVSSLTVQLRTGKIGFHTFLYTMKVPGVESPDCVCGHGNMTVSHVLLDCILWLEERKVMVEAVGKSDLKSLLNSRTGALAAARFVHRTKLLAQFREVRETREK